MDYSVQSCTLITNLLKVKTTRTISMIKPTFKLTYVNVEKYNHGGVLPVAFRVSVLNRK